jgi:hypothetical protein
VNNKETKNPIKKARELAKPFRVTGDNFRLKNVDPGDTPQFASEDKPPTRVVGEMLQVKNGLNTVTPPHKRGPAMARSSSSGIGRTQVH